MTMPKPRIDLSKVEGKFEKPSKYMKWKVGDNRIRVLSEPYQYYVVGKKTARGFVRVVLEDGVEVPEFLRDVEPKLTFGFVIYSHDTEHFHVLETGTMLGVPLVELVRQKWPEEYKALDIIVNAQGENLKRQYTCKYAPDSQKLPANISKDSPEFRFILAYFEGLK